MYGFYLNYVGCKVREELKASGHKPSFTLTMWDVKSKVSSAIKTPKLVLP